MEAPLQPLNFASLARCYAHERSGRARERERERATRINSSEAPTAAESSNRSTAGRARGFPREGRATFCRGSRSRRFIGGSFRRFIGPHHHPRRLDCAPRHPSLPLLCNLPRFSSLSLTLDIDIERIRSFARPSFGGRGRRR